MLIRRCRDVDEFLAHAGEFLAAREAEHNLILGLSSTLRRQPQVYGEDPYLAVVEEGSLAVAAALRTPPHNLVVSEIDDPGAIEPLAADVHEVFEVLPGLLAPSDVAARFASVWEAATGVTGKRVLAERVFRAERVLPARPVPGRMRSYRSSDRELAVRWLDAFTAEALPEPPPEPSSHWLDRRLAELEGSVVLWEDGEPVSLAAAGGSTPNGIRIGPVYTLPGLRGRGYASALVAELTRVQLEGGRRFCFLFTDLANPTSNRIYQRVGYEPVADVDQWSFV